MTTEENPWKKDLLNRSNVADFIYSVAKNNHLSHVDDNALIFSIDGEWGSGKTHFINCWMKDLELKGHPVLRFDAWEHDLSEEPFIALMSEIKQATSQWTDKLTIDAIAINSIKEKFSELLKVAASACIPVVKKIVTHQVKKHVGDAFTDIGKSADSEDSENNTEIRLTDESLSIIEKEFKNQLDSHQLRQESIVALKRHLTSISGLLSESESISSPIFIFIDELDRCRPLYAIKLLETLKHIFNAEGFCFIVAMDQAQLCESIKAVYGSGFNSRMYLKRFFSFDFTLPAPNRLEFIKILSKNFHENFQFNEFQNLPLLELANEKRPTNQLSLTYTLNIITTFFDLNLRSIRQIYNRYIIINSLLKSKSQDHELHHTFLIWCLCLAHKDHEDFINLKNTNQSKYLDASRRIEFACDFDAFGNNPAKIISLHEIISLYINLRYNKINNTNISDGWKSDIQLYSYNRKSPSYSDYLNLSMMSLNYKI